MAQEFSKSQIDRLGDRLKKGNIEEADLRMLDQYRRSYVEAYGIVVGAIREKLLLEPTGRPAKSTPSIAEKLRRESIRLTQIQDIAGCRLIAVDIADQNKVVESLNNLFEDVTVVDRREQPSHGYRAVHVIVRCQGKLIEIQVRTELQHFWAELSEKLSDVLDQTIKYGGGNKEIQDFLAQSSLLVGMLEFTEKRLTQLQIDFPSTRNKTVYIQQIEILEKQTTSNKASALEIFRDGIRYAEKLKEEK